MVKGVHAPRGVRSPGCGPGRSVRFGERPLRPSTGGPTGPRPGYVPAAAGDVGLVSGWRAQGGLGPERPGAGHRAEAEGVEVQGREWWEALAQGEALLASSQASRCLFRENVADRQCGAAAGSASAPWLCHVRVVCQDRAAIEAQRQNPGPSKKMLCWM